MWMKILLHATGRLPRGYRHGTGGFDEKTALDLGFDRDEFIAFVERKLPTYMECEAWVRAHAKHLDAESIRKHNEGIHRNKPPAAAAAQRAFVGLEDASVLDATLLNDLDDWMCVHAQVTTGQIPPLVFSSLNAEYTEILKTVLVATGASRAAIRAAFPALNLDASTPVVEIARDPTAPDGQSTAPETFRSEHCTLDLYGLRNRDATAINVALQEAEEVLREITAPILSS